MADNISKTIDINLKMRMDSGATKSINDAIIGNPTTNRGIAGDINKEQTTTEKANEIDKLAGLTTDSIFVKTIMAGGRLISTFVSFIKWAAPAILAVILGSTAIGSWIGDKLTGQQDESTVMSNLNSQEEQSKFVNDTMQTQQGSISMPQPMTQPTQPTFTESAMSTAPVAEAKMEDFISDDQIQKMNEITKPVDKDITLKLNDSDFQAKAKIIEDMNLSKPIIDMTNSLSMSIDKEKTAMQGLFPVYNDFGELLKKIVEQMAYINNPEGRMSDWAKELSSLSFETPKWETEPTRQNSNVEIVGSDGKGSPQTTYK